MFLMPDIPFAVLVLFILGYIIYLIVKVIKKMVRSFNEALDEMYPDRVSPEQRYINESLHLIDCHATGILSDEEYEEQIAELKKKYNK